MSALIHSYHVISRERPKNGKRASLGEKEQIVVNWNALVVQLDNKFHDPENCDLVKLVKNDRRNQRFSSLLDSSKERASREKRNAPAVIRTRVITATT